MNKPQFEAFTVLDTGGNTFWMRIGAAFANSKGGINVVLQAMPPSMDGQFKIVLLPPKPRSRQSDSYGIDE